MPKAKEELADDDPKRLELPHGHAEGEVKGPAPEVWGDDADRPPSSGEVLGAQLVGMVGDDGIEVKGPDPDQHPQSA